jgi:hypothetical protein
MVIVCLRFLYSSASVFPSILSILTSLNKTGIDVVVIGILSVFQNLLCNVVIPAWLTVWIDNNNNNNNNVDRYADLRKEVQYNIEISRSDFGLCMYCKFLLL